MRDIELYYDNGFDFDVDSNGVPIMLDSEAQSQDQRAGLACVIEQGTIPGRPDVGIAWSRLYDEDRQTALADINQQCLQFIDQCAAQDNGAQYMPLFREGEDGRIEVRTIRSNVV